MLLGLEDVEQAEADHAAETDDASPLERQARAHKRRINRGALPAHLPRIETVLDIDDKTCRCCHGELHRIGEDKSERLDIVPAPLRVLVTRRPKYACRTCEDGVVQAPAPARLIEGGLPTEATVAQVLVSKYADHLPLYSQTQIYARQGIDLDRSTLADSVAAFRDDRSDLRNQTRTVSPCPPHRRNLGVIPSVAGRIRAGTPIAVVPAGTSSITRVFAAINAPSPMVTAPMMLELHEMKT
jgi:transposase